ncbi:hypothetical protein C7974DRAFT_312900 [Boeremia exigua]|uniref:uncharacterized protein n=1 Tax=Boeremia exigua TaxID=749465 RepID=UPI001E8E4813|nr:uncharacterized protein C7974DRAFT_312900 [Boeremia exigua]KAH6625928.1 hypothetical protein C7974DRAFT_312900 [Boeremia exigua]
MNVVIAATFFSVLARFTRNCKAFLGFSWHLSFEGILVSGPSSNGCTEEHAFRLIITSVTVCLDSNAQPSSFKMGM